MGHPTWQRQSLASNSDAVRAGVRCRCPAFPDPATGPNAPQTLVSYRLNTRSDKYYKVVLDTRFSRQHSTLQKSARSDPIYNQAVALAAMPKLLCMRCMRMRTEVKLGNEIPIQSAQRNRYRTIQSNRTDYKTTPSWGSDQVGLLLQGTYLPSLSGLRGHLILSLASSNVFDLLPCASRCSSPRKIWQQLNELNIHKRLPIEYIVCLSGFAQCPATRPSTMGQAQSDERRAAPSHVEITKELVSYVL